MLGATLALLLTTGSITPSGFPSECSAAGELGSCPWADVDDDGGVNVGDDWDFPGTPGGDNGGPGSDGEHDPDWGGGPGDSDGPQESDFDRCLEHFDDARSCFVPIGPTDPDDEGEDAIPPVTISDVARFVPTDTTLIVEPLNIAITGRPANFVGDAQTHIAEGTLFDYPIRVRFTPVEHHYDFGDGNSITTTETALTWADSDLLTFTPTATSHIYAQRGTKTASYTATYVADLDFGGGWYAIPGTLNGPTVSQTVTVYSTRTVLVDAPCTVNPSAPGC